MNFNQEVLAALRAGKDWQGIMEIVRRHEGQAQTEKEAYSRLEQVWRELGFDESNQDTPIREELEYAMERVWYFGAKVVKQD